jgi:hypothetical protein
VDDLSTILFIFFLGDPLGFEGGKGGEGRSTGPDGVVSVSGGDDLDHVLLWAEGIELLFKSIWESRVEGGSSGEDDVLVEVLSDIEIALLDGAETHLMHTESFISFLDETWVEEGLWGKESWGVDGNGLTVWEFVDLLELGGLSGLLLISFSVDGNIAALFLHLSNDLVPGRLSTGLSNTVGGKEVDEMVSDGSSGNVVLLDGMWDGETFIDWDGMGNTISGIADHTGGSTVGVEGEDGLDGNVKSLNLESLEHELSHLLSVGLWVHWCFGEHDLVFGWVHSKFVGEAVFPDLFHLVP